MKLYRFSCLPCLAPPYPHHLARSSRILIRLPLPGVRLTPETPLSPSVNGARIVGATPGARVLFQVPVSGSVP